MPRRRKAAHLVAAAAAVAAVGALVSAGLSAGRAPAAAQAVRPAQAAGSFAAQSARRGPAALPPADAAGRPNVVFVLTDDLSWNLVRYMPHVRQMMRDGMTFTNYTVTDSLCCPSRASIFTGDFPHNTHVYSNAYPNGGYYRFHDAGDDRNTFAVSVAGQGYTTGFAGKYLNQYQLNDRTRVELTPRQSRLARAAAGHRRAGVVRADYAPPGWTNWGGVNEHGYRAYDYAVALDHSVVRFGKAPRDYLTSVLDRFGTAFVTRQTGQHRPFLLELASFAPHKPYVPAPSDRGRFPHARVPRGGAYDRMPTHAPAWLAKHRPLTARQKAQMDADFRLRVESVQAVDRMIGRLRERLARAHQLANTYFVFSSDNGLHMGDYRLGEGKQTPYDIDVRVPLVVTGPGVPAGRVNPAVVENIDLAPTFDAIAGAPVPPTVNGASLLPLLHGKQVPWRTLALVEHRRPLPTPFDPDSQNSFQGTPPDYDALRSATFTYVRYADGEREYYDRATDPSELHNLIGSLPAARVAQLDAELDALSHCVGAQQCWQAGLPQG